MKFIIIRDHAINKTILYPRTHIENVSRKAFKLVWFIINHISQTFNPVIIPLKTLLCTLVRFVLE